MESGFLVIFFDYRGLRGGHEGGLPTIGVSYLIRKKGLQEMGL
jgi:hypothetical protein